MEWSFRAHKSDRLDRLLREIRFPGSEWLSRAAWEELVTSGRVRVGGGRVVKPGASVSAGAEIMVNMPGRELGLIPGKTSTALLWVDPAHTLAIFNKSPGIDSYPLLPWESDTFANQVAHFLAGAGWITTAEFAALAEPPKLEGGLTQRLDRDTSGALLVALKSETKERFRGLFKDHAITKSYHMIAPNQGEEGVFRFEHRPAGERSTARLDPAGETEIELRRLKATGKWALWEARTRFGSRHVIRACLANLGRPLAGDALYGGDVGAAMFHQLHAFELAGPGLPSGVHAPYPQSFLDCLTNLGLH